MNIKRACFVVFALVLATAVPYDAAAHEDLCKPVIAQYGNLRTETYLVSCFSLTPFYWKNGVTRRGAEVMLRRLGLNPVSIITGGFHTNMPGLREPVDYVEIENRVINGRSGSGSIIYESKRNGKPYLGVARGEVVSWKFENDKWRPVFKDLPQDRRWAIASWPWIKAKNGGEKPEFISVQFFGDDASGEPWLEYTYRRKNSKLILIKKVGHRKTWDYVHKRLIFDWTQRRAILLNKDGTVFVIVKGRADAISIAKLMVMLGYAEAIMMDGGSATAPSAINPVYFAVTKR